MLGGLILENQNAFIAGCQILDTVLIASELIDSRIKSGYHEVICKLDNEKTYRHVWEFLIYVMRRLGFGERWISWIFQCKRCPHSFFFSSLESFVRGT